MTKGPLVTQPTAAPVRKVKYAAVWGIGTAIVLAFLEAFRPELAGPVGELFLQIEPFLPVIVATVAGYMTRERDNPATPLT